MLVLSVSVRMTQTAYHVTKDDVRRALESLGLKLVHGDDGSPVGDKCWGFFLGKLHEMSRRWHKLERGNESEKDDKSP